MMNVLIGQEKKIFFIPPRIEMNKFIRKHNIA